MAICEVCGNGSDKPFQVWREGRLRIFDRFECAIRAMAPACAHCGRNVIGHGVEGDGEIFCCASSADHRSAVCVTEPDGAGHADRAEGASFFIGAAGPAC